MSKHIRHIKTWLKDLGASRQSAFIAGFFAIIAAIIGALILKPPSPISQTQATQTSVPTLEMPPTSVQLPQANYAGISITIDPAFPWFAGKILGKVNAIQNTMTYHANDTIDNSSAFTLSNAVNSIGIIRVNLIGKSDDEPVIVDNSIPIKVLSYSPNFETQNLMETCQGGAIDEYLMQAEISGQTNTSEQIVKATYRDDLIQLVREHPEYFNIQPDSQNIPSELKKMLNGQQANLPDSFSLVNKEVIVIGVSLIFKDPGIYKIQFGVQYTYHGTRGIAWADQPLVINVFGSYKVWGCWQMAQDGAEVKLTKACKLEPVTNSMVRNYEYQCAEYYLQYAPPTSTPTNTPEPTATPITDVTPQSFNTCSWGGRIIGSWVIADYGGPLKVFSSDGHGYWNGEEFEFKCDVQHDLLMILSNGGETYFYWKVTFSDDNKMTLIPANPLDVGSALDFVRQK